MHQAVMNTGSTVGKKPDSPFSCIAFCVMNTTNGVCVKRLGAS